MTTMVPALPGDEDLDIDLFDVRLQAVMVMDREVLLQFTGGHGRYLSDGRMVETSRINDAAATMTLTNYPADLFDWFVACLRDWHSREMPLRLVGAPGRAFALMESPERWLPLPRTDRGKDRGPGV